MAVLTLQKFSGQWKLDNDFANVLKTSFDELERATPVKVFDLFMSFWFAILRFSSLEFDARWNISKRDLLEMTL